MRIVYLLLNDFFIELIIMKVVMVGDDDSGL